MTLRLLVEFDSAAKRWSAVFPELPGCGSAGDSEDEAVENARAALDLWFTPSTLPRLTAGKMIEVTVP